MSLRYGPFCADPGCGKRKGKNQRNDKYCYTCARGRSRAAKAREHGRRIEALYGLTAKLYQALLVFQGGRCYICRRISLKRRLSVDHNHKCDQGHDPKQGCPECVRGLLCRKCNDYVGYIRDDPMAGFRLAQYLDNPPFQEMRKDLARWLKEAA